ncbi:hypothetical protein [Micromonospora sp. NPDC051006]|uniref:hypothetical protein n=1 Tax=Micromonospora sp. NPDC051006 TaxID=3364283 RepID=UPI00379AE3E8
MNSDLDPSITPDTCDMTAVEGVLMRLKLLTAVLGFSMVGGCASGVDRVGGDAGPAGSPATTSTAGSTPAATSTSTPASPSRTPAGVRTPASASKSPTRPATGGRGEIRRTDWSNVSLADMNFLDLGDAEFHNGEASFGYNSCTMLPGGARPFYADFIAEEPANSLATEDALVLVECGGDGMHQALLVVQLEYDRKTRYEHSFIEADIPPGPGRRMTFTSYSVERGVIVTTVKKADGGTEKRRYRYDGGSRWVRM